MIYFLINLIQWLASVYSFILLIRVLLSWVSPDPYNPIVQIIYKLTEPLLYQIRRFIPVRWAMIDFSPIIAFLLIELLKRLLIQALLSLA